MGYGNELKWNNGRFNTLPSFLMVHPSHVLFKVVKKTHFNRKRSKPGTYRLLLKISLPTKYFSRKVNINNSYWTSCWWDWWKRLSSLRMASIMNFINLAVSILQGSFFSAAPFLWLVHVSFGIVCYCRLGSLLDPDTNSQRMLCFFTGFNWVVSTQWQVWSPQVCSNRRCFDVIEAFHCYRTKRECSADCGSSVGALRLGGLRRNMNLSLFYRVGLFLRSAEFC